LVCTDENQNYDTTSINVSIFFYENGEFYRIVEDLEKDQLWKSFGKWQSSNDKFVIKGLIEKTNIKLKHKIPFKIVVGCDKLIERGGQAGEEEVKYKRCAISLPSKQEIEKYFCAPQ